MKGFRLISLSARGELCLKSYYSDLGKKTLSKMWKAVVFGENPYSLSVLPASKFYAMALSMSDDDMILDRLERLFLDEFGVVRDDDYQMEVIK